MTWWSWWAPSKLEYPMIVTVWYLSFGPPSSLLFGTACAKLTGSPWEDGNGEGKGRNADKELRGELQYSRNPRGGTGRLEKARCTLKQIFIKMGICQGLGGLEGLTGLRVAFSLLEDSFVMRVEDAWQRGAGTALRGREGEQSDSAEKKHNKDTLADSSAPWAQVAADSPRAWLSTTVCTVSKWAQLWQPSSEQRCWCLRGCLDRESRTWDPLWHLSNPCCSPQGQLQDDLSLVCASSNLKAETPAGPGCPQPCHGRRQLLWGAAAADPTSPCPHTSSSSCTWLKMKCKYDSPVQLLNRGQEEMFQKHKMINATTWVVDNWQCALYFIYLMWVIVAGAAFQGEGLKYCSCCCYKGYLIFFHN